MEPSGGVFKRGSTEKAGPGESVYDVQHHQTFVGEGRLPDLQHSTWDGGTNGQGPLDCRDGRGGLSMLAVHAEGQGTRGFLSK